MPVRARTGGLHNETRQPLRACRRDLLCIAGRRRRGRRGLGAFPNKNGAQVVARLLDTADNSGVFGFSSIYGRGRLDLEAALNPVGFTSLRFEGGGEAPAFATSIDLPSGFQAPNSLAGLDRVVGYDEQGFPFLHDLNAAFRDPRSTTAMHALEGFLASLGGTRSYVRVSEAAAFEFTSSEDDPLDWDSGSPQSERDSGLRSFEAHFQPSPTVGLSLGHNVSYSARPTATCSSAPATPCCRPVRPSLPSRPLPSATPWH